MTHEIEYLMSCWCYESTYTDSISGNPWSSLDAALDEGPPAARRVEGRLPTAAAAATVRRVGRLLRGVSQARPGKEEMALLQGLPSALRIYFSDLGLGQDIQIQVGS